MDLVQTVRKEGSRGGRDQFSWDSVKADQHRENYLGHSLMAPVGRWQNGRDLNWYAKGDEKDAASEADAMKEEVRKLKEAEEDAMARALGQDPPTRNNPNLIDLGGTVQDLEPAPRPSTGEHRGGARHSSHHDRADSRHRRRSREQRRERRRDDARDERHRLRIHHHRPRSSSPDKHMERRRHRSRDPERRDRDRRRDDFDRPRKFGDNERKRSPERRGSRRISRESSPQEHRNRRSR